MIIGAVWALFGKHPQGSERMMQLKPELSAAPEFKAINNTSEEFSYCRAQANDFIAALSVRRPSQIVWADDIVHSETENVLRIPPFVYHTAYTGAVVGSVWLNRPVSESRRTTWSHQRLSLSQSNFCFVISKLLILCFRDLSTEVAISLS